MGHIFALISITANTGATVQGQLLAWDGAVTLDTNTITNGFCATVATTTTLAPTTTTTTEAPTTTTLGASTTTTLDTATTTTVGSATTTTGRPEFPNTGTSYWYVILFAGAFLVLAGGLGYRRITRANDR